MDGETLSPAAIRPAPAAPCNGAAHEVQRPREQLLPVVVASPHSGAVYPRALLDASPLDLGLLRRTEDCHVDRLGAGAVRVGAPLLRAHFPRVFLDVNREPWELDPAMFAEPLPGYVKTRTPRIAAGLGTIPRLVGNGLEIYRAKLTFREARRRVEGLHAPYHAELTALVEETRRQFGRALLIDLHSMPSASWGGRWRKGAKGADIVLGDRYGTACSRDIIAAADAQLSDRGYRVVRNDPYSGGYTTRRYGRPDKGRHALQVEINRALYMDEATLAPRPGFARLARDLTALFECLGAALQPQAA
ncbi:MAG: N-formylglutamate amidohydrolase [Alphaproteobacteria bacterium]|nr:N-formylglutamate amidohydrolase [Alphaproteobacteria bacterium]